MRKRIITVITVFAIVFASAFVFRDATDINLTLSARELDYMTAGQNGYDFSYLTKEDLQANWDAIEAGWQDLMAQYQDSSIAEFFDTFDFEDTWGNWSTQDVKDSLKESF